MDMQSSVESIDRAECAKDARFYFCHSDKERSHKEESAFLDSVTNAISQAALIVGMAN
jgi:hypothetical protein